VLDSYPVLKEYRNAIANLPEIAAFYRSAGFCRRPWDWHRFRCWLGWAWVSCRASS